MRVPLSRPRDSFPYRVLIRLMLVCLLLCGAADADTRYYPESGWMYSDEWDGGADLGTSEPLAECSGPYDARVCVPHPHTFTYTLTIPDSVNMSRVVTAQIQLSALGWFDGNCDSGVFETNSTIRINGVQATDCPWNQPESDLDWTIYLNPSYLHTGDNIIEYDAHPWKLNSDVYGNTIYGGESGVQDIRIILEYSTVPPPELRDLHLSPDLFLTGHDITVDPEVTGESPDWEIVGISYYVIDVRNGTHDLFRVQPDTGNLTYTPAPEHGKYGRKWLEAKLHARDTMTGKRAVSGVRAPLTIYFENGEYPDWVDDDGDGEPNWFEYWTLDGAVPDLNSTLYANDTGYGESKVTGTFVYPLAATQHYETPIKINSTDREPENGESFGGPDVTGIDCAAEVVAHELYHTWVREQWQPGMAWNGKPDSDEDYSSPVPYDNQTYYFDDNLPDDYEETVSRTNSDSLTDTYELRHIKDGVYFFYGDQEYMAMRAGNGKRGIVENDWAYPGKQAGPIQGGIPAGVPPIPAGCSGSCDIVSSSLPGGVFGGVTETPVDGNGNGEYDILAAGNDIAVSRDGRYEISAVLYGDRGSGPEPITLRKNVTSLIAGNYSVEVPFRGTEISSAGIDGPYTVTLTWRHDYRENGEAPSVSWETASYTAAQFEPVSAAFAGDASGSLYGTDLRAVVPLTVNAAGIYTVEGYLTDPEGQTVTHAKTTAAYPAGAGEAALVFDGNAIAACHRDGTYALTAFRILDDGGATVARKPDAGAVAISAAEYGTQAAILTGSFSDTGGDPTSEGRYGVLSISTDINAHSAGDYYYSASLYDAGNGLVQSISGMKRMSTAGPESIPLNFSGKMVFNSRANGSFTLRGLEIYGPDGADRRSLAYTTGAYEYTEFDQPAIVITGNLTDIPVDLDSNGFYDAVRVGFDVDVGHTGCGTTGCSAVFPISANLTGPGGAVISRAGDSPSLERYQTHHVTLDFAGTDINGTGFNGPFGVEDLTAGFTYASRYDEPYQTAAYEHTQFEPAAVLAGFVTNESGFPVAGTRIGAYEQSGYTNAAGYYRLIYGESHTGGVWAEPPGSSGLETGYEIRSVTPGATTFCNFTLSSTAALAGTVTAENGTLQVTGIVTADGPSDKTFTLATWGNGSYAFTGLKPGNYAVTYIPATGADIVANRTSLVLVSGEERVWNITAFNPRSLSGTVRDVNGDPVEGAEVSVTEGPVIITGSYAVETDATGAYAFSRLAPGTSTLYVEPPYGSGLLENTSTVTIMRSDTSVSHDILLEPEPAAPEVMWPDIDPAEGGAPLTVTFTDRSKGYPTAWFWDFGDGTNSTERNPSHSYTAAGTYTVTLTISNAYGSDTYAFTDCITVTDPRVILPSGRLDPAASGVFPFSAGDISDAAAIRLDLRYDPAVLRLDGISKASALVYAVDSVTDNTTGRANITILFASGMQDLSDSTRLANLSFTATGAAGSSTVLWAASADQVSCGGGEGCWPGAPEILTNLSVTEGSIRVGAADPLPTAMFTASPRAGNVPLDVEFDSATSDVVSPTSYLWSFGDGSTSTEASPAHTYTDPGFYDVSLSVTNSSGTGTLTRPGYVSVSPAGAQETYLFVRSFGQEGSGSSGEAEFSYPEGIVIHPSGNLYITDSGNYRVLVVTPDGMVVNAFGAEGTGPGQFQYPRGIAADNAGNVYVADVANDYIQKFAADGTFITRWGGTGSAAGQLNSPSRIAFNADGDLYVTELGNSRVQKFSSSGTSLGMWGSYGSSDGQFTYPGGITTDSAGSVYVTEGSDNHRIQKFDSSGIFISKWGGPGSGDGQFQYPAAIAADADGSLVVADSSNNRVQKFSAEGQYVTQWGTGGTGTGRFNYPYDVAAGSDGLVYVADNENHRIQVFSRESLPALVAGFSANITSGPAPLTVQFTDMSEGSPTGRAWDFGDGTTGSVQNPVHTYTTSGTYTITLTVSNTMGSDSIVKSDYITVTERYGRTSMVGVFRPSTHRFVLSNGTQKTVVNWGLSTDIPVTGDWNGDGLSDVGIYRPSILKFLLKNGTERTVAASGIAGDTPVIGDWNGDGLSDIGVFRPSTHRFVLSNGTQKTVVNWGLSTDTPVIGDWNGDGLSDIGVFRPSTHRFVLSNGTQKTVVNWGLSTDIPVAGDWNGDGLSDIGVYRPSILKYILSNGTERTIVPWGLDNDMPVTGAWS